jgi:hypothetical protein
MAAETENRQDRNPVGQAIGEARSVWVLGSQLELGNHAGRGVEEDLPSADRFCPVDTVAVEELVCWQLRVAQWLAVTKAPLNPCRQGLSSRPHRPVHGN